MSISIEFIVAFFLTRYLIKILKTFHPESHWIRWLTIVLYGVVVLFVLQIIFPGGVILWVSHLLEFTIAIFVFREKTLSTARTLIYAMLPLMILLLVSDIIESLAHGLYLNIEDYLDIAGVFAVIWMIAMVMISNKQNKALAAERKRTLEEEEQNKWISARKAELELEINERTAEITRQKEELQHALVELKGTQAQLIQQEKLASLGELTAGIAHEIQNPLNFVNNFSDISTELLNELKEVVLDKLPDGDKKYANELFADLTGNLEKITHHGRRADSIVKGMLSHSRNGTSEKQPTDLSALSDEYLRLSYHGMRARDKSFNAQLVTNFDRDLPKVKVVSPEIGRVFLNLFNNAFYSLSKKKKEYAGNFSPALHVTIKQIESVIEIRVRDNGTGISQAVLEKIYQPFFTTKPSGEGIGLGLSLSYDIIKAHGGELKANTREGEFAEFIISLPL